MASFHRILKLWGRSVDDKTVQCNCNVNPWDITVNGERWSGKIRLIGFMDVIFLISYSQDSYFNRGIVLYKSEADRFQLWMNAGYPLSSTYKKGTSQALVVKDKTEQQRARQDSVVSVNSVNSVNSANSQAEEVESTEQNAENVLLPYSFVAGRSRADYKFTSIGHEIGLQTNYDKASLQNITLIIHKPEEVLLRQKLKQAFKQYASK